MNEEDKFWIDVSLENEARLIDVFYALDKLHRWTIQYINQYFLDNAKLPAYIEYRKDLNIFIKKERLWKYTQRYTLERTAEKTFPYAAKQIRFDEEENFIAAKPMRIDTLAIRARNVWKKYLAQGKGLTTAYGMIFLEGDWKKILREQAGEIALDLFPYLWHSILLRYSGEAGGWKIKFNFHAPDSDEGEKAEKELEKDYGKL